MMLCCHNPYFNRWFSAMSLQDFNCKDNESHNPYFNRWFSAISGVCIHMFKVKLVTILILIDGFLQFIGVQLSSTNTKRSQSLF